MRVVFQLIQEPALTQASRRSAQSHDCSSAGSPAARKCPSENSCLHSRSIACSSPKRREVGSPQGLKAGNGSAALSSMMAAVHWMSSHLPVVSIVSLVKTAVTRPVFAHGHCCGDACFIRDSAAYALSAMRSVWPMGRHIATRHGDV